MAIMIIYMCLSYEHESCIVYSRNKVCHWNVLNGRRKKEEQEQVNQTHLRTKYIVHKNLGYDISSCQTLTHILYLDFQFYMSLFAINYVKQALFTWAFTMNITGH